MIGRLLSGMMAAMAKTRAGRHLSRGVVDAASNHTTTVRCRGHELTFATPNWLSQYRVETLSTKEPETLDWVESLPAGSVLWDVGANIGLYAIYAAQVRGCTVYAFEPSVFNLELLARNVFNNRLHDRVTIVPLPLAGALAIDAFKMSSTQLGGALSTFQHGIDQNGAPLQARFEYRIVGLSMDDAVARLGLPRPRFLKIDVDGIEHVILRGGPEVLRSVDGVLIEINDAFAGQATETARLLTQSGLSLYRKCELGVPHVFNQWWRREVTADA